MNRTPVLCTVLGAAALATATSALAERRLGGDEIRTLLSGATITGLTSRGAPYEGQSLADGTMTGSVSGGKYTDEGVWDVDGDRYCRKWDNWRNGTRSCFQVEEVGDGEYRFVEDGGRGTARWKITRN